MFASIPLRQVNSLYSTNNLPRYHQLITLFTAIYNRKPEFIARAPGRVDILGGHLDYNHYPVLPVALETDCLIAVTVCEGNQVEVRHIEDPKYPSQNLPVDPEAKVQFSSDYLKYFRAGYRAGTKGLDPSTLTGLKVLIGGNVPTAAGLSSSAAFTVCSALAALHANGGDLPPIAQSARQTFLERVIIHQMETGVAAGGMDQSISVLGVINSCLFIEFAPIRCKPIPLPKGLRFIVMNTLVEEAKLLSAPFHLNKRFVECRMAAGVLARKLGYKGNKLPRTLRQLEDQTGLSTANLGACLCQLLPRKDYSKEELEDLLGLPLSDWLADIPLFQQVLSKNPVFKIWEAAHHILDQAVRLQRFTNICSSSLPSDLQRKMLGCIVRESMKSTQSFYDSSCAESDEMASLALSLGSLGTKITGAGWGGCTLSLVEEHRAHEFMKEMIVEYYGKRPELQARIKEIGIQKIVFESKPGQGACLVTEIE